MKVALWKKVVPESFKPNEDFILLFGNTSLELSPRFDENDCAIKLEHWVHRSFAYFLSTIYWSRIS